MRIDNSAEIKNKELVIFECGKEECIKSKVIALTVKEYHLFHYVYSGKGILTVGNKKYIIGKSTIFYIPPHTDAVYYPDKEDPWSYEWIGFNGEYVNDYLSELGFSVDQPIYMDSEKIYKPFFDRIINRYTTNGYIDLHAVGSLYQLFGEMLHKSNTKKHIKNTKITIELAKDFIDNNYQFDISIVDIAKNANVSPNYLSSVFRSEEKMSTKSYLIKTRMEKAMVLLKTNQFKIKDIAKMVGYSNQLHFSNEFKKYHGFSPRHFVKKEL